ncbi:RNA-directed DNA polymerase, eukaryota [Tanacetum coccineum]
MNKVHYGGVQATSDQTYDDPKLDMSNWNIVKNLPEYTRGRTCDVVPKEFQPQLPSKIIHSLYIVVFMFGQHQRSEPLYRDKKMTWKREMTCLLSVCVLNLSQNLKMEHPSRASVLTIVMEKLDSEGCRVAVKYYSDDWPTNSAKESFDKYVFTKTQKTNACMEGIVSNSFAAILKSGSVNRNTVIESSPAIVLDDACFTERDFSCSLMRKMKDINALYNLFIILANEVWVAIEGLPVKALTRNMYAKIIASWGKLVDINESDNCSLSCIRVCVRTKPHVLINDRVKIIIKGQLHWICVKEQEAWMPEFKTVMEDDTSSDEESEGNNENDRGSDNEHVSETSFAHENVDEFQVNPKPSCNTVISEDPFGIYKILKRNKDANVTEGDTHTPQYPPGFTPNVEENVVDNIPGNASQPKPNPTTSGNKEKASSVNDKFQASGSILEVMDELIKVGQTMGYNMDGCLGNKAKKGWIQELNTKHRVNFVALQETKKEKIDLFSNKALWGNLSFDYAFSPSIGYLGGTWIPSSTKLLVIYVYASQDLTERRMLWDFIHHLIDSWDGECVLLGYAFTWAHKSASKISKLDRFLIFEGLLALFPSISALCHDKHLLDHQPILLRELNVDYGPTPFRFFHSWSSRKGFDKMSLKSSIKHWLAEDNQKSNEHIHNIQNHLIILDKIFDQGSCNDDLIHERSNLLKELQDFNKSSSLDMAQKAKIRWAIEGDENSKFFHGIINKKRSELAIHGVLADGDWIVEPSLVKNEFLKHFATRFAAPSSSSITFDYQFPNRLTPDQIEDLERNVSYEEIKRAV